MGSPLLTNLDQGTNIQFIRTYLGPSLGWRELPVAAEADITTTSPYVVGLYDNRIILKAACKSVLLPPVAVWMEAQTPVGMNWAGWNAEIWVKDYSGDASSGAPIVVTPNGSETIDGLASYSIITPNELLRLYPITNLTSGWYLG